MKIQNVGMLKNYLFILLLNLAYFGGFYLWLRFGAHGLIVPWLYFMTILGFSAIHGRFSYMKTGHIIIPSFIFFTFKLFFTWWAVAYSWVGTGRTDFQLGFLNVSAIFATVSIISGLISKFIINTNNKKSSLDTKDSVMEE